MSEIRDRSAFDRPVIDDAVDAGIVGIVDHWDLG